MIGGGKGLKIFILAFVIVVLVGEAYAYSPADGRYSSEISAGDSVVSYTVHSNGSHEYTALLLDNGTYEAVTEMYIYRDSGYVSAVNENVGVVTGAVKMTQDYYLDQLVRTLEYKGMDSSYVDAEGLREMFERDIAEGSAGGRGIAVMSGALPSTVYSGSPDDLVLKWIGAGGSLYWAGNYIGRYVSEPNTLKIVHGTELFTGTDAVNSEDVKVDYEIPEYRALLCLESNNKLYSVDSGSSVFVHSDQGFTDGKKYSTIQMFKVGDGQVCLVSGDFSPKQVRDVSTAICSGLCYCSRVASSYEGIVDRSASGELDASDLTGNGRVYIFIGGYFCVYGGWQDVQTGSILS